MTTATDTGAAQNDVLGPLSEDSAADEFLKRIMPPDAEKDQPSEKAGENEEDVTKPEAEEEASADDEQPEADDEAEDEETEDDEGKKYADDGTYVKIKVGEEEHEVPVKDLQRLYGQEASLTKKSMEVAEQRKSLDQELAKVATGNAALLERAKERLAPYMSIDFNLAAKELPAEEYMALRQQALNAYEDVQFLEQNLNGLMQEIYQKQEAQLVQAAEKSLEVLSGPVEKGGIEGFSEELYDDIRQFAVTEGVPEDVVNKMVEPWAVRLVHDAMLYKRGKSKVLTKKVNKTPKKVIKVTKSQATSGSVSADKVDKAMKTLRTTGSTDAAADVFMARWGEAKAQQE